MRKIWIFAVCGLGLILGATHVQAQTLVPGPVLELSETFGSFPRQVELGDANGDGDLDILTDQGVIFLADGDQDFSPQRIDVTGAIAFADLNGDGIDDLIFPVSGPALQVLFGDASETFEPASFSLLALTESPSTLEVADFDGNGHSDIAVVSETGTIELFSNDGAGILSPASGVEFTAENIGFSTSGDINNDGADDIAVVDPFDRPNQIHIFLGDSSGAFSEAPGSPLEFNNSEFSESSAETIAFFDMDQDGNEDLVGLSLNVSAVGVFSGDGEGNFSEITGSPFFFTSSDTPEFLRIGDMNSDNVPDVVTANRVRSVSVMINNGQGGAVRTPAKSLFDR